MLGLLLIVIGVAGSVGSVVYWSEQSFGNMEPSKLLRLIIPSVLAFTLGCQLFLSSFFLGVLGMGVRR